MIFMSGFQFFFFHFFNQKLCQFKKIYYFCNRRTVEANFVGRKIPWKRHSQQRDSSTKKRIF